MGDAGWWQACVRELHEKIGQPAPDKVTPLGRRRTELRISLMEEELSELRTALRMKACFDADAEDIHIVKEICDLLYVTFGTAVEMGIPLERFFAEVHRSNMTKNPGNLREDGKILKGPEYEPPRLEPMLERLKERGR